MRNTSRSKFYHRNGVPQSPKVVENPTAPRSIELVQIALLRPSPRNARVHSKKQIGQIATSLTRFGFQNPVIVNKDNVILAGHGRVEAAKTLNLQSVPCLRVETLSPEEERAFMLADNAIALKSGYDRKLLAAEIQDLDVLLPQLDMPIDLTDLGFDQGEIDALILDFEQDKADADDDHEEPGKDEIAVTVPGDLWLLGEHRLLCGDARSKSGYETLLGGQLADIVVSDPPFNVAIGGNVSGRGAAKHREFAFASGEMTNAAFEEFLLGSIGAMSDACRAGALLYIFTDWRHVAQFCQVGEKLDLELVNICVWNKTTAGQGSFYRSAHELICVFHKHGVAHDNNVQLGKFGRSRSNVWTYPAPNKFLSRDDDLKRHPTPKPIAMIAEALKDASSRSDIVIDGFLGSGTTLLAAEKVGRTAYCVEIDPLYVDLSIRRWQTATRRDAVLATTGETFDERKSRQQNGRSSHPRRRGRSIKD